MEHARLQVIGLIGAGAISSAAICSFLLLYTLPYPGVEHVAESEQPSKIAASQEIEPASGLPSMTADQPAPMPAAARQSHVATVTPLPAGDGVSTNFLVEFLSDADPAVRTTAIWWLTTNEESGEMRKKIFSGLQTEQDPRVRQNFYRALHGQDGLDCEAILRLVKVDPDPATKIVGYDLIASIVSSRPETETARQFNAIVVPELKGLAVGDDNDLHVQLTAVMALRRANTPAARLALAEIANSSTDDRIVEAARNAKRSSADTTVVAESEG